MLARSHMGTLAFKMNQRGALCINIQSFEILFCITTIMVEKITSPDGKFIQSDDYDLPEHLQSKWIPIEQWEDEVSKIRNCPLCNRFTLVFNVLDIDDGEGECSNCNEYFTVKNINPLTVIHDQGALYKYWFPMQIPEQLSKKGLEFELRETENSTEAFEEAIYLAVCWLKNDIQRLYEEEMKITDLDFDVEEIDKEQDEYILDDDASESE